MPPFGFILSNSQMVLFCETNRSDFRSFVIFGGRSPMERRVTRSGARSEARQCVTAAKNHDVAKGSICST